MSSKKAIRRERRAKKAQESERKGLSPVTLFIVGIVATVAIIVTGSYFLVDRSGPGEPPYPGAVWSAAHGHWH